jgi:hypothetical protein
MADWAQELMTVSPDWLGEAPAPVTVAFAKAWAAACPR